VILISTFDLGENETTVEEVRVLEGSQRRKKDSEKRIDESFGAIKSCNQLSKDFPEFVLL